MEVSPQQLCNGLLLTARDPSFSIAREKPCRPTLKYCREFIESRIHDCLARHSACRLDIRRCLPNRVLHVGEEDNPQSVKLLAANNNETVDYVTLSHYWGAPNDVPKTTRTNLQYNLESIGI